MQVVAVREHQLLILHRLHTMSSYQHYHMVHLYEAYGQGIEPHGACNAGRIYFYLVLLCVRPIYARSNLRIQQEGGRLQRKVTHISTTPRKYLLEAGRNSTNLKKLIRLHRLNREPHRHIQ